MRIPLLSQSRRGRSYQINKRAAGVRDRDVAARGHDVGGGKDTTATVSSAAGNGEQHGGDLSGDGQNHTGSIVSSRCISTNSSIHEVYFLLGDEDSVADVAERVKATCAAIVSPAVAVNYNYTSGSEIEISSESWEVVQWYRESTFALGYNSTAPSTDTLRLDSPFFTCLNTTISTTLPLLPLLPNPIILKSHSGWHPNGSNKGGEIIVICFLSILFGPFVVPVALMVLEIVLLTIVTAILWCLEMCCTCCGLVSCSDGTVEKPQPQSPVVTQMPTPTKRMSGHAEKGGSQARDSSYAGNSLRFPPDAVIARTRSVQDWDTFRLLTGSHYHYDDSIMARAYHASQISRSNSNNGNIQIVPPADKRLSLSEAKSVLVTRTSTTEVEPEGDKNPFADSDAADSDSVADSINEAPPSL